MIVAKGNDCDSFPQPTEPVQFQPFFGKYSRTGGSGAATTTAPASTSAGGDDYTGYDPRLYESPPQEQPQVQQPEPDAERRPRRTPATGPVRPGRGRRARSVARAARDTVRVAELDLIRAIERALRAPGRAAFGRRAPARGRRRGCARPAVRGDLDRHGRRRRALRARHPLRPPTSAGRRSPRRCPTSPRWAPTPARPTSRWCCHRASTVALELVEGMEELARPCGVTIAGGDVVQGPALMVTVTVDGLGRRRGAARRPRRRPARRPGGRDRRARRLGGRPAAARPRRRPQ